ncbi:sensor histidine kinase [Streptomyces bambusae]|uniref:sensor histidine kinase n=1 Tax=Streptomyces bambusae TaxID=1550616 RepID=UPI001CFCF606|nr:sensor histidine kinase [Streptomyces bambusae]MCB5168317.1 sensor histidine kinase [Streptomyces bambusae]
MNLTAQPSHGPANGPAPAPGVPKKFRGPFARWPRSADAVLATLIFLATVFVEEAPGDTLRLRAATDVPVAALLLYAGAGGSLYWRRTRPIAALALAIAAWSPLLGTRWSSTGGIVLIALYSIGRYVRDTRENRLGTLAAVGAAIAAAMVDSRLLSVTWGETSFCALVMFTAWYVGRRVTLRAERAERLRREQAAETRRIVAEERTHIARELHDVVAHRVSMMTVQAGAARMVAAHDPQEALAAMTAVEEAGRQALDELRHLLGVLRPEADREGLGPQPGLADLDRLVAQVREAGLDVSVTGGVQAALPARVELSAYRIVQEALTNVLKHSGPRTRTEVRLSRAGGGLRIEVLDDGQGAPVPSESFGSPAGVPGHGIVGMRERALLLGGSLDAGRRPGGGFRLAAHLPTGGDS